MSHLKVKPLQLGSHGHKIVVQIGNDGWQGCHPIYTASGDLTKRPSSKHLQQQQQQQQGAVRSTSTTFHHQALSRAQPADLQCSMSWAAMQPFSHSCGTLRTYNNRQIMWVTAQHALRRLPCACVTCQVFEPRAIAHQLVMRDTMVATTAEHVLEVTPPPPRGQGTAAAEGCALVAHRAGWSAPSPTPLTCSTSSRQRLYSRQLLLKPATASSRNGPGSSTGCASSSCCAGFRGSCPASTKQNNHGVSYGRNTCKLAKHIITAGPA